jgi:ribosomal-protein-serine acetyltransferase
MSTLRIDEEIVLKTLEPGDADLLFSLIDANRSYLRQWLPWVDTNSTVENSRLFILSTIDQQKMNLGFQCGIWYRGELSGIIGYHGFDWMNRNVEIGYWLGEKFQSRGIMTKACRALVDYAFHDFHLNRVQIRCATGNKKSNAIIERLGFINEGCTRQAELLYDHYVDLFVYGMTSDMWMSRYGQQMKILEWTE